MSNNPLPNLVSKDFLLGGRAIFTVVSGRDGKHYTYKINRPKEQKDAPRKTSTFFAKVLTGPDNNASYSYLGIVCPDTGFIRMTAKSKVPSTDVRFKVLAWAVKHCFEEIPLPAGYACMNAGTCGVCGRTLTTPESIDLGIGPYCIKRYRY